MTVPMPPVDRTHRSPNAGGYGGTRQVQAWCVHITDGTNSLGWLTNPASQASANYLLRRDGYLYELVPPDVSPWTNGDVRQPDLGNPLIAGWVRAGVNPNTRCLTVECEGHSTAWRPGALTSAQEAALVGLLAWGCDAFGLPADATHIIRHSQINDVTRHNCPGFSPVEWSGYIAAAARLVAGDAASAGEGEVREPAVGQATAYLTPTGQLIVVANFGGIATTVKGVAWVNVGGTVENAWGEQYSRSLLEGVFAPWHKDE